MAGINQHYIPKFVQKGFASRGTGARTHIWLFHRERDAAEPNVAGSCSERYFYGERHETAVDERITEYESKQLSPLWESLCMSPAGPVHLAGIPEMLVHFETRTKNFRDLMAEPIEQMRSALQGEFEDIRSLTTRMVARARKRPRSLFPSPTGRDLKIRTAIRRMLDEQLRQMFLPILSETGGQFQHALSALVVQRLTKEAHNRSLAKLGVMPERAKLYAALRFVLLDVPDGELVLGDSVTAVLPSGSDRWYPFLDNGVDPQTVLLPMTAERILLGGTLPEALLPEDLNNIAARSSRHQFIASKKTAENERLVNEIGKWASILSSDDVRQTIGDCMSEAFAGTAS